VGLTPFPFLLPPSLSLLPPQPSRDPATTLLPCACSHPNPNSGRSHTCTTAPRRAPLCMCVKTLCTIKSRANPSDEMAVVAATIPDAQAAWIWSTIKNQGQDPSFGEPRAVPTQGGGGMEGSGWGVVPDRGRHGASRLRVLLRAWLQPPRGGFLPQPTVLLQARPGTSCSQLHYCSVDVYSLL
jgi:hypothetical protein